MRYKRPKLTSYQRAIVDSPARFTVVEAATKCGKTASHVIWLFEQALGLKEGQSVWWVAPTYAQAEIAYRRMKKQARPHGMLKSNDTAMLLITPNGGRIYFKSAEKPDNLFGEDVFACVFDEFTRAREDAWFALRSTLTSTNGKCKLIGNAKGKKNWGYKLGQRAKAGEQGYEYFKITAYDAAAEGIIDIAEIEQAKIDLPEHVFKELYLAEPSEDGSNPFGYDKIKQCIKPISLLPPVAFGVDLAKYVDWTAIIGLDSNADVCYFNRFQKNWHETKLLLSSIIQQTPAVIDSTGVGDPVVEELQRTNYAVIGKKYTSNSKQQLMELLAGQIQAAAVGFPDGVIEDELMNFEYEYTRTGVKYSAPAGLHDDCVNALAMAVECKLKNPPTVWAIV